MAQQTAVEWLASNLDIVWEEKTIDLVEQAKQMEMMQIVQAYHRGLFGNMELEKSTVFADEYYNETFKK
jgi:hypothetical protein